MAFLAGSPGKRKMKTHGCKSRCRTRINHRKKLFQEFIQLLYPPTFGEDKGISRLMRARANSLLSYTHFHAKTPARDLLAMTLYDSREILGFSPILLRTSLLFSLIFFFLVEFLTIRHQCHILFLDFAVSFFHVGLYLARLDVDHRSSSHALRRILEARTSECRQH